MRFVTHGIDIHCYVRYWQHLRLYVMKQGRHKITYCRIVSQSVQCEINYKDGVIPSLITVRGTVQIYLSAFFQKANRRGQFLSLK